MRIGQYGPTIDVSPSASRHISSVISANSTAIEADSAEPRISDDGRYEIEGNLVDERELELRMCAQAQGGRTTLHIRADKDSKHSNLVRTMDLAKTCGFTKLGILHRN